jgi:hypothetical protein
MPVHDCRCMPHFTASPRKMTLAKIWKLPCAVFRPLPWPPRRNSVLDKSAMPIVLRNRPPRRAPLCAGLKLSTTLSATCAHVWDSRVPQKPLNQSGMSCEQQASLHRSHVPRCQYQMCTCTMRCGSHVFSMQLWTNCAPVQQHGVRILQSSACTQPMQRLLPLSAP